MDGQLKVGDRVIDFRGEKIGVVTNIREGRVSRHVTVAVDGDEGRKQENYEGVWKKIEDKEGAQ